MIKLQHWQKFNVRDIEGDVFPLMCDISISSFFEVSVIWNLLAMIDSPPKELLSIITCLFPIGLPMPGGPISSSASLTPLSKDEPDEKYDKYYSHIICFLLLTSISVTPPSRISAESAGQNISLYHSIGRRYADVVRSSACRCCRSPLSSLLRSHAVLSLP